MEHGTDHLKKRKNLQYLNSNLYGKENMMKPKVDNMVLSSGPQEVLLPYQ